MRKIACILATVLLTSAILTPANASVSVDAVVVDVDFTSATLDGNGKIPNSAADKLAELTPVGSPSGLGTAGGLIFANTSGAPTAQYLTGNIGTTSDMTKIVVEFTAKFPDAGCALQSSGSMVFSLGSAGNYVSYNIYRHSNFIGLNTFNSDIYGTSIPDQTNFYTYKIVMVPNVDAYTVQSIFIDGVQKSLSYKTTSSSTESCSAIMGSSESSSARVFSSGSYSNGNFMFMTHALNASQWRTTGTVKNLKITTTTTQATATVPAAPTISSITSGDSQLSVAFTAGSNGGATITDYKYSTDNGSTWTSAGTTSSPIVITGLTNGTTYNVKLRAVNSVGDGTASSASTGTPKGNQTVTWAPTNTAIMTTASPATPSSAAATNGDGAISYAVQSAGTTGCSVNPSTGELTFTAEGSCVVRASAAGTTAYNSAYKDVTFVITEPSNSGNSSSGSGGSTPQASATPTPTPSPSPTRSVNRTNGGATSSPTPSPTPSPTSEAQNNTVAPVSEFAQLGAAKYVGFGLDRPTNGKIIAVVAERIFDPIITTTSIDTKVDLGSNGSLVIFSQDASGSTKPLNSDAVMQTDENSKVRVEASGFAPNSPVEVWLFSTPVRLGSGLTNSAGDFSGEFEVPTSVPEGRHSLQINGINKEQKITSIVVALEKLQAEPPLGISDREGTWGTALVFGAIIGVVLGLLIVSRRKKIRRSS